MKGTLWLINLWLLWCYITLIALDWMCFWVCAQACVRACVCEHVLRERCFHGRVSKAFHSCLSFLSSRNTSLNYSFKTPPLLVSAPLDWHAAAYFPLRCLLCPAFLYTLFLYHASVFSFMWTAYFQVKVSPSFFSNHSHIVWLFRNGQQNVCRAKQSALCYSCVVSRNWRSKSESK